MVEYYTGFCKRPLDAGGAHTVRLKANGEVIALPK